MSKKLVLCLILVAVLVVLYMVVRRCGVVCEGRNRSMFGPVNPNAVGVDILHKNPCDLLAMNGYKPEVVQGCNDYGKKCGTSSTLYQALEFSQMYDPFDPDAVGAMQSRVADVMDHPEHCSPPAPCSTTSDCHPFGTDFDLKCQNITCVPDDCKPGEECVQKMICTGSCL